MANILKISCKLIFLNENHYIFINILRNFVWNNPINNQYTSIGSDNDLAPSRRQVIIWINVMLGIDHNISTRDVQLEQYPNRPIPCMPMP